MTSVSGVSAYNPVDFRDKPRINKITGNLFLPIIFSTPGSAPSVFKRFNRVYSKPYYKIKKGESESSKMSQMCNPILELVIWLKSSRAAYPITSIGAFTGKIPIM